MGMGGKECNKHPPRDDKCDRTRQELLDDDSRGEEGKSRRLTDVNGVCSVESGGRGHRIGLHTRGTAQPQGLDELIFHGDVSAAPPTLLPTGRKRKALPSEMDPLGSSKQPAPEDLCVQYEPGEVAELLELLRERKKQKIKSTSHQPDHPNDIDAQESADLPIHNPVSVSTIEPATIRATTQENVKLRLRDIAQKLRCFPPNRGFENILSDAQKLKWAADIYHRNSADVTIHIPPRSLREVFGWNTTTAESLVTDKRKGVNAVSGIPSAKHHSYPRLNAGEHGTSLPASIAVRAPIATYHPKDGTVELAVPPQLAEKDAEIAIAKATYEKLIAERKHIAQTTAKRKKARGEAATLHKQIVELQRQYKAAVSAANCISF